MSLSEGMEDNAVCEACGSGESLPGNAIVFCDGPGCTVTVHQECYGVRALPQGEWLCGTCAAGMPVGATRCAACPKRGGAMKPVSNTLSNGVLAPTGQWCHVVCACWIPELHFDDDVALNTILGVASIIRGRYSLRCTVCDRANAGACVQCYYGHCPAAFHPSCIPLTRFRFLPKKANPAEYTLAVLCDKHQASVASPERGSDGEAEFDVSGPVAMPPAPAAPSPVPRAAATPTPRDKSASAGRKKAAAQPQAKKKSAMEASKKKAGKNAKSKTKAGAQKRAVVTLLHL